jgi:aryl-alcohol dehydrogenase-like predicted oxidoreductase
VLGRGEDIVPIPGTKRLRYLEENLKALDVRLEAGEVNRLEAAFPKGAAAGERYSPRAMLVINR